MRDTKQYQGLEDFMINVFQPLTKNSLSIFLLIAIKEKYNTCTINPAIIYGNIFKGKNGVCSDYKQKGTDPFFPLSANPKR